VRIKVGIFFGGSSREREVSFAGGRTVYDNLDKELFEPVAIFVDEFGNLTSIHWPFIYRGTIRDFYPPVSHLPDSPNSFQIYSESIALSSKERRDMLSNIGEVIQLHELPDLIDFAFLALHGEGGEDGNIQGLLEWYGIPYSGSGILPSSIGMNKAIQKDWMSALGYPGPKYTRISKTKWKDNPKACYQSVTDNVGFPVVVKSANQGSSIGVNILKESDYNSFKSAVDNSFFEQILTKESWNQSDKVQFIRDLSDIRSSLGFPLLIDNDLIQHPEEALAHLDRVFLSQDTVSLQAIRGEVEVVVEQLIKGKEFSCIVVKDENARIIALPPTEIAKSTEFFDYKSKYLPGLSRKITPIGLPDVDIETIRESCSKLFKDFGFNVYARIDGFYTEAGEIFLNDPNTTSGMMPSSFFFHQAAEIGLNPSQFLSFLIRTSIAERIETIPSMVTKTHLLSNLDEALIEKSSAKSNKKRVAIIMGGYSTERHISVESGRNIYEKLASSGKYQPIPIFLTGSNQNHRLFELPINVMLKDNADDIKSKVEDYNYPNIIAKIVTESASITTKYTSGNPVFKPKEISYDDLPKLCESVFIALHGRPGEDGQVQVELDRLGLPYNGSGVDSSSTTIDKFKTNNILREAGFLVANGFLITKQEWQDDQAAVLNRIKKMQFPFIAKPSDEGCSSAVKKLKTVEAVEAYATATFRTEDNVDEGLKGILDIQDKEEFPAKDYFLLEQFIDKDGALHFLEITGGLLTKYQDGQLEYEIFEPSEALAEGEILSLAEKFLAGEGQNITPARFSTDVSINQLVSNEVRRVFEQVARRLKVEGYCRIDAFVRIFEDKTVEVVIIEINSLPGMTPATCIYHQAAINGYKPFDFIDEILTFGEDRLGQKSVYEKNH
jgi:UDP-N-acetylmuramate--alanine ligase